MIKDVSTVSLALFATIVAGCTNPSCEVTCLRVTNSGPQDIRQLSVLFPDGSIDFGHVPPGVTTEYREVRGGVYRYAAFRLELEGRLLTLPVIDWLGESPLPGRAFTYELALVPFDGRQVVQIVAVTTDQN
jgi:hypothetical protein